MNFSQQRSPWIRAAPFW